MLLAFAKTDRLVEYRSWLAENDLPPQKALLARVTLHKTITGVVTLPLEVRRRSKAWLDARSFTSFDDGDL